MKNKEQPLVSVFIPTRNRPALLKRAIDSVLAQTWSHLEIVVVDDASDDDTQDFLSELAGNAGGSSNVPLTILRNETLQGAPASRNMAIAQARGEFITGLDDDDFWRPRRVEILMEAFEEGYSAVCSYDTMVVQGNERVWKKPGVIPLNDLLFYNRVGNQVLTRREYLIDVGGYDENLPSAQDYDLWIRLAERFGPVKTAPYPLQVIRMDEDRDRISNTGIQSRGYYACYKKHREKMTRTHRKYQLYRIRLEAGKKVSWTEMDRSAPPSLWVKEVIRRVFNKVQ